VVAEIGIPARRDIPLTRFNGVLGDAFGTSCYGTIPSDMRSLLVLKAC